MEGLLAAAPTVIPQHEEVIRATQGVE